MYASSSSDEPVLDIVWLNQLMNTWDDGVFDERGELCSIQSCLRARPETPRAEAGHPRVYNRFLTLNQAGSPPATANDDQSPRLQGEEQVGVMTAA